MTDLGNYTIDQTIEFIAAPATDQYTIKLEFNNRIFIKNTETVTQGDQISLLASELNEDYVYCARVFSSDGIQVGSEFRFKTLCIAQ